MYKCFKGFFFDWMLMTSQQHFPKNHVGKAVCAEVSAWMGDWFNDACI